MNYAGIMIIPDKKTAALFSCQFLCIQRGRLLLFDLWRSELVIKGFYDSEVEF